MHTVVLLQGKCKSINVYRRAIYRRARRGGKLIKKLPFLGHLSPKVYTHTMFVFPPFPRGSSWLSGHSLATFGNLPSGRGYVHRRAMRGDKPGKKKKSLATSPPKGSHIYIYIHTHYVCFSSFLFPGNLHDSLDILWQPLRKSGNLCGSLAIPSQVYEHKGLNMM